MCKVNTEVDDCKTINNDMKLRSTVTVASVQTTKKLTRHCYIKEIYNCDFRSSSEISNVHQKMYGGLFGDLPATKHGETSSTTAATTTQSKSNDGDQQLNNTLSTTLSATKVALTTQTAMIVPHRIRPRQQPQSHIRKRPLPQQPPPQEGVTGLENIQSEKSPTLITVVSSQPKSGSVLEPSFTESKPDMATVEELLSDTHQYPSNNVSLDLADRLRILNETAVERNDIYNPMIPNDVLVYWEQQGLHKEQAQYEQERQSLLQQQEMIRQQLEQERNQLLQQAIRAEQEETENATNDESPHVTDPSTKTNVYYQKMIQQEQQRTMGRGRGNISNLPAWLIQKQQASQPQQSSNEK